jgi:uncharacterized protein YigA (DUF484 family)
MNRHQTEAEATQAPLTEADVASYLRQHPEFFQRQRELVAELRIPHDVGSAISLVAFQVRSLREERRMLRAKLDDLLRVARENDRLSDQIHRLTLELLETRDLDGVVATLCDGLRNEFEAEQVKLRLAMDGFGESGSGVAVLTAEDCERLAGLFPDRRPVIGQLTAEQRGFAFGAGADDIHSAAVMPLEDGPVRGLIAVGSRDPERYRMDHGTVFLGRIGDLVARVLRCCSAGGD